MRASLVTAVTTALAVAGCGIAAAGAPQPGHFWRVAFGGHGHVVWSTHAGAARVTLLPARPASALDTHSALVLSRRSWRDLAVEIRIRTNNQLRRPSPNPWEVGWVLWHYRGNRHFYFIILKPNGWELGKEDAAYPGNQQFLATGTHPAFPPGRWYTVRIQQRVDVITVEADGHRLARVTDTSNPYRWGQVGLYSEDASASFQPIAIGAAHDRS